MNSIYYEYIVYGTRLLPISTAIVTVVSRNPIHAILWLIATFIVTCGIIFYQFSLGFTCSLIIIVYIGAIAVRFRFITMIIPIKERTTFEENFPRLIGQGIVFLTSYIGSSMVYFKSLAALEVNKLSEFWLRHRNQLDYQGLISILPNRAVEGITIEDLYRSDLALYGARLYQEVAFPILLTGLVLLFVLVAAIVLCQDE